jgi:hypothetical protein
MVIENRSLTPGTRLVASYRKQHYACIVGVEDGRSVFTLEDGRSFKSPSAAGSALMNGAACNGWRFWSVEGEMPAAPAETPEKPKRAARAKKANGEHRNIKPATSQKGAGEGLTKYFCDSCMKGFEGPTEAGAPEACPEGHPALIAGEPVVA